MTFTSATQTYEDLKQAVGTSKSPAKATLQRLALAFRSLIKEQLDIDYRLTRWCAEARAVFGPSADGDMAFKMYCINECNAKNAGELLDRARVGAVVTDVNLYNKHGIKKLLPLTTVESSMARKLLARAENEGRQIGPLVREVATATVAAVARKPYKKAKSVDTAPDGLKDARTLAKCIRGIMRRHPEVEISDAMMTVVKMYAP